MQLLVITNIYPPQNLGGFGLCMQRLTDGLAGLGYQAHVLTGDQPQLGPSSTSVDIQRDLQLLGKYHEGVQNLQDLAERQRRQEHNLACLNTALSRYQPDACLIGNLDLLGKELLDAVLEHDIPTIQHIGFMGSPFPGNWLPINKPFSLAFASREVRRLLVQMGLDVADHPIVHPPLQSDQLPQPAAEGNGSVLRIGFSGLLMQSKGVHVLLEAASQLKASGIPFQLSLAGKAFSEDYSQALQHFCGQAGMQNQVHWLGFVDPDALSDFYQSLDVLVFPSLHPESFGMVVAEAMSHGVLPISSGVGGAFEVITHGVNGLLVEPGQSQDLAAKLIWCYQHRDECRQIKTRARRSAQLRFTPIQSATALANRFEQLRQNNRPKANPNQSLTIF